MRVRIDRVGRLVIPKALRDAVGIGPDTDVEVSVEGAALRLEPVAPATRVPAEIDGFLVIPTVKGRVLTDDDVRDLRDADER